MTFVVFIRESEMQQARVWKVRMGPSQLCHSPIREEGGLSGTVGSSNLKLHAPA